MADKSKTTEDLSKLRDEVIKGLLDFVAGKETELAINLDGVKLKTGGMEFRMEGNVKLSAVRK